MDDTLRSLREKAMELPLSPGVYLMRNAAGKIIYVGKSKALKNRVSQYFSDSKHDVKTQKMISHVRSFDYMLTDTEMEALSLENRLIKLHMPKFNICLKDAKSYPYLKITAEEYPRLCFTRTRAADGGRYFGPYSGSFAVNAILKTAERVFGIPTCRRVFPRDIGKDRPCLFAQIGQCVAPCANRISQEEYRALFDEVELFLKGHYDSVERLLHEKMEFASEHLHFEAAAQYRDRLFSLQKLRQKQKIIASPEVEQDVFALFADAWGACLSGYYIRCGSVMDSDHFLFSADRLVDEDALTAFLCDLYQKREFLPKEILLGFALGEENLQILCEFLKKRAGYKVTVRLPERGNPKALCDMVLKDAHQHALAYRAESERDAETLVRLATLLELEVVPERIEAFDISNLGSEHITAGMVVLEKGKLLKREYRCYKIRSVDAPDDYASMREAVARRIAHAQESPLPDLLLLDGGKGHVAAVQTVLDAAGLTLPVFGMVKDDFHKTRALTDATHEIGIARDQGIFTMIYKLQEEVHRFTVSKMSQAKRKSLRTSSLEKIAGIGQAKARLLLQRFKTLSALREAEVSALRATKGISERDAQAVYRYFHGGASSSDIDTAGVAEISKNQKDPKELS